MDCNKTINFLHEFKRLCASRDGCEADEANEEDCPMFGLCVDEPSICAEDVKVAIEAVQKWSDEQPKKTYAQDFFEKFPDAQKHNSTKGRYPAACRNTIYGGGCMGAGSSRCWKCWNEPMEE